MSTFELNHLRKWIRGHCRQHSRIWFPCWKIGLTMWKMRKGNKTLLYLASSDTLSSSWSLVEQWLPSLQTHWWVLSAGFRKLPAFLPSSSPSSSPLWPLAPVKLFPPSCLPDANVGATFRCLTVRCVPLRSCTPFRILLERRNALLRVREEDEDSKVLQIRGFYLISLPLVS